MSNEEIILVYDHECPVCSKYAQVLRIRESIGKLTIINARNESDIMVDINSQELDIDQGMVLKMGNKIYYGSDAIHMLALISSRSGVLNRLNYWFFKSESRSRVLYPILLSSRNLLLKILGKSKINNLNQASNNKFE